jgi:metal-dependent hydrolase (beta-lactamase superfamily II)
VDKQEVVSIIIELFRMQYECLKPEESIPLTIAELKREDPRYIVPCHCTGWKGAYEIVNTMPEKFIQPSVGSIFCF